MLPPLERGYDIGGSLWHTIMGKKIRKLLGLWRRRKGKGKRFWEKQSGSLLRFKTLRQHTLPRFNPQLSMEKWQLGLKRRVKGDIGKSFNITSLSRVWEEVVSWGANTGQSHRNKNGSRMMPEMNALNENFIQALGRSMAQCSQAWNEAAEEIMAKNKGRLAKISPRCISTPEAVLSQRSAYVPAHQCEHLKLNFSPSQKGTQSLTSFFIQRPSWKGRYGRNWNTSYFYSAQGRVVVY